MSESINIVIAGASGYIGKALIPELLVKFPTAKITALSRDSKSSTHPQVDWKSCDLFSTRSLVEALPEKIDLVYYLVHSMSPTAELDQGNFSDYDLLLANNFSRAVAHKNLKQLIYLGGLIPQEGELSPHLKSRLEVEETFREFNLPLTIFRAGLILGENGSSFQILLKLVSRLPVMVCPKWTQTLTTPTDLESVKSALLQAALNETHFHKTYDLASCKPLTYLEMMDQTGKHIGYHRFFFTLPLFTPTLSRLWVSTITQTPRSLVYPLIESLEHPMVARESHLFFPEAFSKNYSELLHSIVFKIYSKKQIFRSRQAPEVVRSVYRLWLPPSTKAETVSQYYFTWLHQFLGPFIQVRPHTEAIDFTFLGFKKPLLHLKRLPNPDPKRVSFLIEKGLLVAKLAEGHFEFREVLSSKALLITIYDFKPALPSFIYSISQALIHTLVMRQFKRFLMKLQGSPIVTKS